MTADPVTAAADETLEEAARKMRDGAMGNVIVLEDGEVCGILTDRDIVVWGVAEGRAPGESQVADVCSRDLIAVGPEDSVDRAVELMRENAIRGLPVVEDGQPVGIVAIGDLAIERDPRSALRRAARNRPTSECRDRPSSERRASPRVGTRPALGARLSALATPGVRIEWTGENRRCGTVALIAVAGRDAATGVCVVQSHRSRGGYGPSGRTGRRSLPPCAP
jgi:predicted transcriptional regulator